MNGNNKIMVHTPRKETLFMKKNMCDESKCPWILEHPWLKPNVQLFVLAAIAFIAGMFVDKLCI